MAIRFSTVGGESGSADTARDPRGFAMKFYTDDGIWDLVGNNTPIFFIRDPILFPSFIHTQKRNPQTHLKDPDMFWDFITLRPETTHQVSMVDIIAISYISSLLIENIYWYGTLGSLKTFDCLWLRPSIESTTSILTQIARPLKFVNLYFPADCK